MAETTQNELIQYMFLRDNNGSLDMMGCLGLWFGKSNDTDIEIKTLFGHHIAAALTGAYDDWKKTPRGCLALMILVDQFPRNIYRHTVQSFAGHKIARTIVDEAHDWLHDLKPEECIFVPCLIMTHQENVVDQEWGLRFYYKSEHLLPTELHIFRVILEEHARIIGICGTQREKRGQEEPAAWLSKREVAECHETFRAFDKDGNGSFDKTELATVLGSTGRMYTEDQIQTAMDRISGREGSTSITFEQFSALLRSNMNTSLEVRARRLFERFDADSSGGISLKELKLCIRGMDDLVTGAEIEEMLKVCDSDHNGELSFEEFSAILPRFEVV
ncbi:EF-hand [Hyaloscypha variabilis]